MRNFTILRKKIIQTSLENRGLFIEVNFGYEHWTAIYNRKKLLKYDVLYPDIRNGQDDIFLLDSTYHLKSISLISDTYYNYRQHSSSTISIRKQPYFDSITTVFRNKMNFINNHEISKSDYLSYFYLSLHIINIRYNELKLIKELEQYKRQFVSEVLEILKMYKYDKYDLLTNMYIGFGKIIKPEKLLKEDYTYKIYRRLKSVKAKIFG